MFDSLAEKLQATLSDVRGRGTLTEADISARDARDPARAARGRRQLQGRQELHRAVKERALGADVVGQLNPGQQVVKIVSDELTELMGGAVREIWRSRRAADGGPDGGAAGLRQDDRHRQAGPVPA